MDLLKASAHLPSLPLWRRFPSSLTRSPTPHRLHSSFRRRHPPQPQVLEVPRQPGLTLREPSSWVCPSRNLTPEVNLTHTPKALSFMKTADLSVWPWRGGVGRTWQTKSHRISRAFSSRLNSKYRPPKRVSLGQNSPARGLVARQWPRSGHTAPVRHVVDKEYHNYAKAATVKGTERLRHARQRGARAERTESEDMHTNKNTTI
jgi:hypothetical protein